MGRFGSKAVTGVSFTVCLLACAGVAAFSQQANKTFTVDVKLVRLLATVKDQAGQLIGSLKKEDFTLYDNGVPQEIRVFEHHTEQPLSIALMVDISGSTAKDIKYEVESTGKFLRSLFNEGNDRDAVSIFSFNWEVRRQTSFTRSLPEMMRVMRMFKPEAGTSMYDAIYLGAEELERREGRHVLVMVTDGGDTVSQTTYHQALQALHRADSVFYAILVMPIVNDAGRNIGGENALTTLAQGTGGKVFLPSGVKEFEAAFDEILRELRTQYLLGYYPTNVPLTKDRFHRTEIRVNKPGLHVLSRTGYYGEAIR